MKTKSIRKEKVNLITLGCSKNWVDSENIVTQLKAGQIDISHESDSPDANVIIINTCGFIDRAKEESIETILRYATAKADNRIEKLYVTGCLSHRYKDDLEIEIPEVDAWFGTMELPALLAKFKVDYRQELLGERQVLTPVHYAYLKISEGCNRTCSFCAIPLMRGGHVSRPIEDLVAEARNLARQGVKEIILIAQELTYYGLDLYKERALSRLLKALAAVEGVAWIRLHYAYPSKFPLDVLDIMNDEPKICKYLDIPLQHANDQVLTTMKRQISRKETTELIHRIREKVPGIAIRTTFLVGFPGESDAAFQDLCAFVREMEFERVGVFQYSHEENTSAHLLKDDVPDHMKQERANLLMEIQREISLKKNMKKIGQTLPVLIDRVERGVFYGRTEFDSPEVDNEVIIHQPGTYLRIGDFADVRIDDATEYDLFGTPIA